MSKPVANSDFTPANEASAVLRALALLDEAALREAIVRALEFCESARPDFDNENGELLEAVVGALRERPLDPEPEPMVHVCIDLLNHLANQSSGAGMLSGDTESSI